MKDKEKYLNTKRLYKAEVNRLFKNRVPLLFRLNKFLFRLFLPRRFYFFMQQVVFGYGLDFAFHRAMEWSMDQIINWQKERI